MRRTDWEDERLQVFLAAELARRHRDRGLLLNAPESIALICDAMFEAARAGLDYAEVKAAGLGAVARDEVLPDVPALVRDVRLEVLMDDGTRLVVLLDPLGAPDTDGPGAVRIHDTGETAPDNDAAPAGSRRLTLSVTNTSTRVVRVSSHYPFERVNRRLMFDRDAARGHHLDLPAGSSERWSPGETRTVALVPFHGRETGTAG